MQIPFEHVTPGYDNYMDNSILVQIFINLPPRSTSPLNQHILYRAPVVRMHLLLQFLLGQPLEVRQTQLVILQIRLTTHYSRLHEKSLLA